MKYHAVLFDFDGTLTPSLPLWIKGFQIALHQHGVDMPEGEIVGRFFYRDWNDIAHELGIASVDDFREAIHAGLRVAFHEAELFPNVVSLLKEIRTAGKQVALVTSAPRFILDDVMPRLELSGVFDCIVCADDVQNFKPHPEPVMKALAQLNCPADKAIMIGDSSADILSGKSAGTATALFIPDEQNSLHNVEALRATDPDYIFAQHSELPQILAMS